MEWKQKENEFDRTPWEGDYREPIPEDFLPDAAAQKAPPPIMAENYKNSFHVSFLSALIIIAFSLYRWLFLPGSELAVSHPSIFIGGEYWRLWTSVLVHSDFGHIASNLWLFGIFGYLLHTFWGPWVFPFLSFSVLGGLTSLLTILWYANPTFVLGASGMIYGMIGLWIVSYIFFEDRFSVKMRIFRALGFVLVMLFPSTIVQNVSYSAHALGFAIGAAVGILLCLIRQRREALEKSF